MEPQHHYATVTEAMEQLRKEGFTLDFSLNEDGLVWKDHKFSADDFEIVDVYRYEGNSDPGDEATVYAIESKSGLKGILMTSYGMYAEEIGEDILKKLQYNKPDNQNQNT